MYTYPPDTYQITQKNDIKFRIETSNAIIIPQITFI